MEPKDLSLYHKNCRQVCVELTKLRNMSVTELDIQLALFEIKNISQSNPEDLVDLKLTIDEMKELLKNFNFDKFHPIILCKLKLNEISLKGRPRLLVEKRIKINGDIWEIHKNDADPWPSNPHAHNQETSTKLDLSNGDLWCAKTRKFIRRLKKKTLLKIIDRIIDEGITNLPQLSC